MFFVTVEGDESRSNCSAFAVGFPAFRLFTNASHQSCEKFPHSPRYAFGSVAIAKKLPAQVFLNGPATDEP